MSLRYVLISDLLCPPFDEGMKVYVQHLAAYLSARGPCLLVTNSEHTAPASSCEYIPYGKRLATGALIHRLRSFGPDRIIYVPGEAGTFASFLRTWLLAGIISPVPVVLVNLQPRSYGVLQSWIIRLLGCPHVYVQGKESRRKLQAMGLSPLMVSSGVDVNRFVPVSKKDRQELRVRWGLAPDSFVILHVGHLKATRNIEILGDLARHAGNEVVLATSTSTDQDSKLAVRLEALGVRILRDFVSDIETLYQAADCYLFPVVSLTDAIDMPLSVLEALSCGIPVVSSPFGALPERFAGAGGITFFSGNSELEQALGHIRTNPPEAQVCRKSALAYSWSSVLESLCNEVDAIESGGM